MRFGLVVVLALSTVAAGLSQALFVEAVANSSNVFSTTTLAAPTGVSASVSGTTVNLSWTATSSTNASGHRVLRGTASGGPYTQIAQIAGRSTTTYADTPGAGTFYYVVRAYYDAGGANWFSANSNEAAATVANEPYVFKSTTANTGTNCASAQRLRDMEQGYTPSDPVETIARTGGVGTISFCTPAFGSGQALSAGTTTVEAYFNNSSGASCAITATLYLNGTVSLGSGAISIAPSTSLSLKTWSFSTASATFATGGRLNLYLSWEPVKACDSTYLHFDGTTTNSRVRLPSISAADTEPPAAPTALTATTGAETVALDWADNTEPDLASYRIYRRNADGTWPSAPTATSSASSYTDSSVVGGTSYTYRVTAVDQANNESAPSGTASATPTDCPYDDTVLATAGLVSYWRLGEATGTTAADAKGANHGSYVNGALLGQPNLLTCGPNTSVKFDGVNDHVSIPDANSLDLTSSFSLEAWVRLDALPGSTNFNIVAKTTAYYLGVDAASDKWIFGFYNGASYITVYSANPAIAGQTYHLSGTYDGATLRIYVNGSLSASLTTSGSASINANRLYIASWNGSSDFANGRIDEAAVYNTVLTATQVQQHYAAGTDVTAPAAPTSLTATAGAGRVVLDWADNTEADLASTPYRIYRQNADGSWPSTATATSATSGYTDIDLTGGTTYSYRVTAVDTTGNQSTPSATAGATPTAGYRDTVLATTGLQSYWRLGETSSASAADSKGTITGSYVNGVTLGGGGALLSDSNGAPSFDGVDDYVEIGDVYDFAGTAAFSIEFWIKKDVQEATKWARLIDKHKVTTPRDGWVFSVAPDTAGKPGVILFERWGGGTQHSMASSTVTAVGTWYHVVGTYDGATMRLYVNGVLESSRASSVAMSDLTVPLRIAASAEGGSNFDGTIDEVAIYNVALTGAQVLQHFNAR